METIKNILSWGNVIGFIFSTTIIIYFLYYICVRTCPYCKHKLPKWRFPKRWKELYWGGWTCGWCGRKVEVDALGRPLNK